MSLELECQVGQVDKKQNDRGSSRNGSDTSLGVVAEALEGGRDDQRSNRDSKHTGSSLGDGDVEVLGDAVDTTKEEAHTQDEKQVGEHTSDQGCLHNENLVLSQSDDTDD